MDRIPGLDLVNDDELRNPFEGNIPIPMIIENMRSAGDFKRGEPTKFAQGKLFKGYYLENTSKKVSILQYDDPNIPDDELTYILLELEILTDLDHNNVLKFYETIAGSAETEVSFVFEPHYSLLSELVEKDIEMLYEPAVIKTVMRGLFSALHYLHQNQIIHRDIQPENILFTSSGVVKVWNFRNAQRIGRKARTLMVKDFRYQSPDLLLGFEKYDESVDIWSANVIFLQLWEKKPCIPPLGREHVLKHMFRLLGFPKKEGWEEFFNHPSINNLQVYEVYWYNMLERHLAKFCDRMVPKSALDLLRRCFRFSPKIRPKAEYCLLHPYFTDEPRACPVEKIVSILGYVNICDGIKEIKDKKTV